MKKWNVKVKMRNRKKALSNELSNESEKEVNSKETHLSSFMQLALKEAKLALKGILCHPWCKP